MAMSMQTLCQADIYSNVYRNLLALTATDSLIIEIITPIAGICMIANLLLFWRVPNFRQPPFDVLLSLSIFSLFNIAVYAATLAYNGSYPVDAVSVPASFDSFCYSTGTLIFCAKIGMFFHTSIFSAYYALKIKNPLKAWANENKSIWFICVLLTLIMTMVAYLSNWIGVSAFGTCGLKVSKLFLLLELGINSLYLVTIVLTSGLFLKHLQRMSRNDSKARKFFKYYLLYVLLISSDVLLHCVSGLGIVTACIWGQGQGSRNSFSMMESLMILIFPVMVTVILWHHPEARKAQQLPKWLKQLFSTSNTRRSSFYDEMLTTSRQTQFSTTSKQQQMHIQLRQLNRTNQSGLVSNLKENNRVSLLATILGCVCLQSKEFEEFNRSSIVSQSDYLFTWNVDDRDQLQLTEAIAIEEKQVFVEKIQILLLKFISYSSSLFRHLMTMDGIGHIAESVNPYNNLANIYNNAQGDGGRSGQFFFFTRDNRLILKTLSTKELKVLLDHLYQYYMHFKLNRSSFIVKIYGVYTVINPSTNQQLHFMLMGNLCGEIGKQYVNRIYDLKGSSHQRQVFKDPMQEQQYSQKTMKDLDFQRLESKVWVAQEKSQQIIEALKKDSLFFCENGLIDYSLIIIKVNFISYCKSLREHSQSHQKMDEISDINDCSQQRLFLSTKQPEIAYIIGIIDYLQTWNVQKKSEKWYKSLFTQSQSISSQSPQYYSERFCNELVDKIFG